MSDSPQKSTKVMSWVLGMVIVLTLIVGAINVFTGGSSSPSSTSYSSEPAMF